MSTQTLPGEWLYRKLINEQAEQRAALVGAKQQLHELGLRLPRDVDLEYSVFTREFRAVTILTRKPLFGTTVSQELAGWCRERTGGGATDRHRQEGTVRR
jgi:hypothetical protein